MRTGKPKATATAVTNQDTGWLKRLDETLDRLREEKNPLGMDRRQISGFVQAPSRIDLELALARQISSGKLLAQYRVVSRETGRGLADYPSRKDIPVEIYDPDANVKLRIDPLSDVKVVYFAPQPK